jgi:hypothetical protein
MAQDANQVSTDEIRSQIERTRVELGQTIDAIQDRLSPRRVMHEAKETLSEATIGRVRRLAEHDPTATALAGAAVGAAILAVIARSRPRLAGAFGGFAALVGMAAVAQHRAQQQEFASAIEYETLPVAETPPLP